MDRVGRDEPEELHRGGKQQCELSGTGYGAELRCYHIVAGYRTLPGVHDLPEDGCLLLVVGYHHPH